MAKLEKDDLRQMSRDYFEFLDKERLIKVLLLAQKTTPTSQKKKPGHQPGSQGKWRSTPLKAQVIIPPIPVASVPSVIAF